MTKLTSTNAVLMIVTAMLGYGIICIPKGAASIGYTFTTAITGVMMVLTYFSLVILFKSCSRKHKNLKNGEELSYYSLIADMGRSVGICINFLVFLLCYTTMMSYTKVMSEYGCYILGIDLDKFTVYCALGISILQFLLSFMRDISILKNAAYLSIFSCLFVVSVMISYFVFIRPPVKIQSTDYKFQDAAGPFIFALCCQTVIPIVYTSLDKNVSYNMVSIISSVVGGTLILVVSLMGYMTGGNEILDCKQPDILSFYSTSGTTFRKFLEKSFDKTGKLIKISQILFIMLLNCSYIVQFYTGRMNLMDIITRLRSKTQNSGQNTEHRNKNILSLVVSIFMISTCFFISRYSFVNSFVNYSGIYLINFLNFILPAIAFFYTFGLKEDKIGSFMSMVCLMSGIGGIIILSYLKFKTTEN